jgi:hypothetical protein
VVGRATDGVLHGFTESAKLEMRAMLDPGYTVRNASYSTETDPALQIFLKKRKKEI